MREMAPGIEIIVRLSAFDMVPFKPNEDTHIGEPVITGPYKYAFGGDKNDSTGIDLTETCDFIQMLYDLGIRMINVTGGSPYYTPHLQRPALFPPSDGYLTPEDPLVGVERHISVTSYIKERFPDMVFVGTGYTYLQEYLPHVAQAAVSNRKVDSVGVGRMVLSYPDFWNDIFTRGEVDSKRICRTLSHCTTSARAGLRSGCYPLDPFYRDLEPDGPQLRETAKQHRAARRA